MFGLRFFAPPRLQVVRPRTTARPPLARRAACDFGALSHERYFFVTCSGMSSAPRDPITTILIVDDSALVRSALRSHIAARCHMCPVGEAANGLAACQLACARQPEVVLMDVNMPVLDGIEAARRLRRSLPTVRVLLMSFEPSAASVRAALAAGAHGFLSKSNISGELDDAVRTVRAGRRYLSPELAWMASDLEEGAAREDSDLLPG